MDKTVFKALLAAPATLTAVDLVAAFLRKLSREEAREYSMMPEFVAWALANHSLVQSWSEAQQQFVGDCNAARVPTGQAAIMYQIIIDCRGAEIHESDWPIAEALVERGLITLGGARGPGRTFRRALAVGHEGDD